MEGRTKNDIVNMFQHVKEKHPDKWDTKTRTGYYQAVGALLHSDDRYIYVDGKVYIQADGYRQ